MHTHAHIHIIPTSTPPLSCDTVSSSSSPPPPPPPRSSFAIAIDEIRFEKDKFKKSLADK
jgi:hypothetical protein